MNKNWTVLPDDNGHFMFGYYDRNPWDENCERHLALKIPQQKRLPRRGEKAEVGYILLANGKFIKISETRAWCHQQGSMTLWLKHLPETFIFNDYIEKKKMLCARVFDINGQEKGYYDKPIYSISKDGKWGSSLNFGRIPRRGYSYADVPLKNENKMPDLDNDGLFLVDLQNGKYKLIVPYRRFIEEHPLPYTLEGNYFYLAHVIFNSDSSRIMVLFEQIKPRQTSLFTMNIDGSDLICCLPSPYWHDTAKGVPDRISHQIWGRYPREILVDANWCGHGNQYVVFDEGRHSMRAEKIADGFGPHGHLVFSPDGKWMAADTYPDKDNIQHVGIVNVKAGKLKKLGCFRHHVSTNLPDLRCDLHPRWSGNGKYLSLDSIHSGERKIYVIKL